jgi:hypothetical protein
MTTNNILKWVMTFCTWLAVAVLLLFVLSIIGGIVFIAKTVLLTILSPFIYIFNLLTAGPKK